MSKEVLKSKTCKELRDIAKDLGVVGRWEMSKDQLISEISKREAKEIDMEKKMPYIENAAIGSLVAFKMKSGKVKSAKIMKKSHRDRKLLLETDYGAQFVVSFDDIIWVRTGKRWPRGVYEMLTGKVASNGC